MENKTLYENRKEKITKELKILNERLNETIDIMNYLKKKDNLLDNKRIFITKEIFEVITYLVSEIEEVPHLIKNQEITLKDNDKKYQYKMVYLTPSNRTVEALREIFNKFNNQADIKEIENNIGKNYIQLALFEKNDFDYTIDFAKDKIIPARSEFGVLTQVSKIVDLKYSYIMDYLNKVIDYRIIKEENNQGNDISKEELYNLADEFISKYKDNKDNEKILKIIKKN